MARASRWPRRLPPARVEPPAWVRSFDPAEWAVPDEWEESMSGARELPPESRRWHAERRWHAARNAWLDRYPEADHRLEELLEGMAQDWRQS
jgi:hypothetical protein